MEGEPGDGVALTYGQLHRKVCQAANALEAMGVKKEIGSQFICR